MMKPQSMECESKALSPPEADRRTASRAVQNYNANSAEFTGAT